MDSRGLPSRRSIRTSLTWRVTAVVAAALAAFLVVYQTLVVAPLARRQSQFNLGVAGALLESRLSLLFDRVARDLRISQQRAIRGEFSMDDVEGMNRRFGPYLRNVESVSSVLFARDDGREILVLQLPDGTLMNRVTDATAQPGRIRRIEMDQGGEVIEDEVEDLDYDPRRRPWYRLAMKLEDGKGPAWTRPYVLLTTQDPGITASIRWKAEDGHDYVLAFDVLLRDLASAVQGVDLSRYGQAAVLTQEGVVLSAPRADRGEEHEAGARHPDRNGPLASADSAMPMRAVAEVGTPALQQAFSLWKQHGRAPRWSGVFEVGGQSWSTRIQRYPLHDHGLCLVTMAPSDGLTPTGSRVLTVMIPVALVLVGFGTFFALRLARTIGGALEQLAAESERIGSLDFSDSPVEPTPWRETETLAQAHRHMRDLLRESRSSLETANNRLEARVEERTRELHAANAELAAFSYAVSHDLRSPLRGINGYCHLLESDHGKDWDDSAKELLARIRANTTRMDDLIDGLLSLARLSSCSLEVRECDMVAIAREVVEELRNGNPHRAVSVQISDLAPAWGDPALIRDVLANLIGNAWKYTARTDDARIDVRSEAHGDEPVYVVADNGPGFDMAHATHLFSPFRRLHAQEEFPGTGIGLATVRRILELHGGAIWAESAPGRGTTFFFTIPRAAGGSAAETQPPPTSRPPA